MFTGIFESAKTAPAVFVIGNDARGVLFGVGHLLRQLRLPPGSIAVPDDLSVTTAPKYPLRGHQLGAAHVAVAGKFRRV